MRLNLTCCVLLCIILMQVTIIISQEVNLNSTLIRGRYALPDQYVTFTCKTRGTEVMEWLSEHYIGAGGDLIEIFSRDEGSNQTRLRGMTVATRTGVYDDSGITVIVSQLHIIASDNFRMSSVACRINTRGPNKTINFNVTDLSALQEVNLNSTLIRGRYALSGERVTFTCEARGAEVIEWVSEDYIGVGGDLIEIFSRDEGSNQTRLRGMTVATRTGVYDDSGITVIVSQLHIIPSDNFPMSSVACRINTRGPNKIINFNVTDFIPTTDSEVTGSVSRITTVVEATEGRSDGQKSIALIAGITCITIVIAVFVVGAVFLVITYIYTRLKHGPRYGNTQGQRNELKVHHVHVHVPVGGWMAKDQDEVENAHTFVDDQRPTHGDPSGLQTLLNKKGLEENQLETEKDEREKRAKSQGEQVST